MSTAGSTATSRQGRVLPTFADRTLKLKDGESILQRIHGCLVQKSEARMVCEDDEGSEVSVARSRQSQSMMWGEWGDDEYKPGMTAGDVKAALRRVEQADRRARAAAGAQAAAAVEAAEAASGRRLSMAALSRLNGLNGNQQPQPQEPHVHRRMTVGRPLGGGVSPSASGQSACGLDFSTIMLRRGGESGATERVGERGVAAFALTRSSSVPLATVGLREGSRDAFVSKAVVSRLSLPSRGAETDATTPSVAGLSSARVGPVVPPKPAVFSCVDFDEDALAEYTRTLRVATLRLRFDHEGLEARIAQKTAELRANSRLEQKRRARELAEQAQISASGTPPQQSTADWAVSSSRALGAHHGGSFRNAARGAPASRSGVGFAEPVHQLPNLPAVAIAAVSRATAGDSVSPRTASMRSPRSLSPPVSSRGMPVLRRGIADDAADTGLWSFELERMRAEARRDARLSPQSTAVVVAAPAAATVALPLLGAPRRLSNDVDSPFLKQRQQLGPTGRRLSATPARATTPNSPAKDVPRSPKHHQRQRSELTVSLQRELAELEAQEQRDLAASLEKRSRTNSEIQPLVPLFVEDIDDPATQGASSPSHGTTGRALGSTAKRGGVYKDRLRPTKVGHWVPYKTDISIYVQEGVVTLETETNMPARDLHLYQMYCQYHSMIIVMRPISRSVPELYDGTYFLDAKLSDANGVPIPQPSLSLAEIRKATRHECRVKGKSINVSLKSSPYPPINGLIPVNPALGKAYLDAQKRERELEDMILNAQGGIMTVTLLRRIKQQKAQASSLTQAFVRDIQKALSESDKQCQLLWETYHAELVLTVNKAAVSRKFIDQFNEVQFLGTTQANWRGCGVYYTDCGNGTVLRNSQDVPVFHIKRGAGFHRYNPVLGDVESTPLSAAEAAVLLPVLVVTHRTFFISPTTMRIEEDPQSYLIGPDFDGLCYGWRMDPALTVAEYKAWAEDVSKVTLVPSMGLVNSNDVAHIMEIREMTGFKQSHGYESGNTIKTQALTAGEYVVITPQGVTMLTDFVDIISFYRSAWREGTPLILNPNWKVAIDRSGFPRPLGETLADPVIDDCGYAALLSKIDAAPGESYAALMKEFTPIEARCDGRGKRSITYSSKLSQALQTTRLVAHRELLNDLCAVVDKKDLVTHFYNVRRWQLMPPMRRPLSMHPHVLSEEAQKASGGRGAGATKGSSKDSPPGSNPASLNGSWRAPRMKRRRGAAADGASAGISAAAHLLLGLSGSTQEEDEALEVESNDSGGGTPSGELTEADAAMNLLYEEVRETPGTSEKGELYFFDPVFEEFRAEKVSAAREVFDERAALFEQMYPGSPFLALMREYLDAQEPLDEMPSFCNVSMALENVSHAGGLASIVQQHGGAMVKEILTGMSVRGQRHFNSHRGSRRGSQRSLGGSMLNGAMESGAASSAASASPTLAVNAGDPAQKRAV